MRPEIISDLDKSTLRGEQVMTIHVQAFPADGPMFGALGTFLTAAAKAKLTTAKEYGRIELYLPPTDEELERALSNAQESWDGARQMYQAAMVSGTEPEDYTKHTIRSWAKKECLRLPWEAKTDTDY